MISDNDLLLYYYRDGLDRETRERIAAALSEQPELAARLHRLVARLDAVAATPDVAVPEDVQRRWQAALDRASAGETPKIETPRRGFFTNMRWQLAAVGAASLLVIVTLKVAMQSPSNELEQDVPMQAAAPATYDSAAFARGLRLHLASTETQLATVENASDEERARLIETIIAQNDLYAMAAERANEPQLARVLRAFTPVLEQVADGEGASTDELSQLDFEIKVMQARLAAASANRSTAPSSAL